MKVTIVGGGPGGLYTAILLRLANPGAQVTVLERNAPDDTFGFGVVFSAATLAELEDADPVSHDRMASAWARWDPVEVRHRGEVLRAGGNRFAAISRHLLLRLLQERAVEVGVDLRFGTEVADPADHGPADLVVAADGVNSATRRRHADVFEPRTAVEGCTYIWLGTDRRFDAFTFIFEQTEFGPFQAHIYPFSDDRSTFIVECTKEVWRAAGLERVDPAELPPGATDEHSRAYLRDLFADHLDGHDLIGNNSRWLDWVTVKNARWHAGRTVLLGDAAHTAHFSIGSGTKLAMEDAIALTQAITRCDDLDTAIAAYEAERRPQVDRVQDAASDSLAWFGRYPRYLGFPAPMFAYSLLTRSSRVDHDNLRRRDPDLVLALDRWFAEDAEGRDHTRPRLLPPPPSSTPATIGPLRVTNRTVLVPGDQQDARDGVPSEHLRTEIRTAVQGGAGLVVAPRLAVSATGRATPADLGMYDIAHVAAWRAVLGGDHDDRETISPGSGRAPVAAQVTHAGPRAAMRPRSEGLDRPLRTGGWERVAASPVPYTRGGEPPHSLDPDSMAAVTAEFVAATEAADAAGFDLLEIDAAHGNLLATFLSPLTNRREDEWGGDVAARLRFPLSVVDAVRAAWPATKPLSVRFSASDRASGGLSPADAITIARALVDHGADLLHVVSGQTTRRHTGDYAGAFNAGLSDLVRNGAGALTLVTGGIRSVSDVDHLVLGGRADLCVVGPLPDEPAWLAARRAGDGGRDAAPDAPPDARQGTGPDSPLGVPPVAANGAR